MLLDETRHLKRTSTLWTDKEFLADWLVKFNEKDLEAFHCDEIYRVMIISTGISVGGAKIISFIRRGDEYYVRKKIFSGEAYEQGYAKISGPPLEDSTQILRRDDWDEFIQLLKNNGFWNISSGHINQCYDCTYHFVEGINDKKHHIIGTAMYEKIFQDVREWLEKKELVKPVR